MRKIAIIGLVVMVLMASMIVMVPHDVKANPTPGVLYQTTAGNDVNQVAVSGDGSTAAAASDDGKIYVIGRDGLKKAFSVTSGEKANCVAVSRDGNYVVGGDSAGYLWLLDSNGSKLDSWQGLSESNIYSVDISQNGNYIVDSDNVGISHFDASSHNLQNRDWYDTNYADYIVDMSDDGNRILLFDNTDMMVKDGSGNDLWSSKWTEPNNANINWADMSEDGSTIIVTTDNDMVYLLSASNSAEIWHTSLDGAMDGSISYDGSKIVCFSYTGIVLFDKNSSTPEYVMEGSTGKVSYDGKYVAVYDWDGEDSIKLYSTSNKSVWVHPINDDILQINNLAISDDGSHIIGADSSYDVYYLSSVPETNILYDLSYTSGGTTYLSDTTTISLSADYIAPSVTTYWKVDNEAYHIYSGPFKLSSYSEGNHTLYYYSKDSYGNTEIVKSLDFYLDKNAPSVTITSPIDGSWVNSAFTVEWNGSDDGSGIDHYEVRIDSGSWTNVGKNTSYEFTEIDDGQHTVDVESVDMFAHEGSDSITLNVDGSSPSVSITNPSDKDIVSSPEITVSWIGTDGGSGIGHYEVRIDGGNWINEGTDVSHTFSGLSDGNHTVDVKAVDNAGNEATDNVSFVVDMTAPTLDITSPSDGSIFDTDSVSVSWTGSDETSGIGHYEVRIDGGSWTDVGNNTTHTFSGLSDGNHTVDVKAVDNAGNEATNSVGFTVDTTAPSVHIESPSDGSISLLSHMTISWKGSDATSGIDHYEVRIDGGSWTDIGTSKSYSFKELSYGSHTVEVKAVDNAGNEQVSSVHFKSSMWWILILLIVIGLILAVVMKKKKGKEEPESTEESEPDETEEEPAVENSEDL